LNKSVLHRLKALTAMHLTAEPIAFYTLCRE